MKKKIVIASVLKPVDDVRAYWKLSQSMTKTNKYEVNIIGNTGKKEFEKKNIKFHLHSLNRNNWLKRIITRELVLIRILRIKPSILIITTQELINTALLAKMITGCKVIYDVQENYSLNLSVINSTFSNKFFALLIRAKEKLSSYFIDQYWLAENVYREELPFTKAKCLVIENKAFAYSFNQRKSYPLRLLFSGTVSEYGGVKRTVNLFKEIQSIAADASLQIIGQVHDERLENWLKSEGKNNPGLKLRVSQKPIPYSEILEAISEANLGVIGYRPNRVNAEKIPTKLYEYSRYRVPYIVQENTKWSDVGLELGGAIPVDLDGKNWRNVLEILKKPELLFPNTYPENAKWENESIKVITSLERLIVQA